MFFSTLLFLFSKHKQGFDPFNPLLHLHIINDATSCVLFVIICFSYTLSIRAFILKCVSSLSFLLFALAPHLRLVSMDEVYLEHMAKKGTNWPKQNVAKGKTPSSKFVCGYTI